MIVIQKNWLPYIGLGIGFWIIGFVLWSQQDIDEAALFYYNAARIARTPIVVLSEWLSAYGMAVITAVFVVYLLAAHVFPQLDAPLSIYLYTICSLGLSGIAGDLLKEIIARPRPVTTYGHQILVLSQSLTPAMPSGHTVKSIALVLPFLMLVPGANGVHRVIKMSIVVIAGGVCFSRIVLGAHYVSDVAAGIGMGLVGFPLSMSFANMILKQTNDKQLPILSKVWGVLLIFLTLVFMSV